MPKAPFILVINSGSSSLKVSLFRQSPLKRYLDATVRDIHTSKQVVEILDGENKRRYETKSIRDIQQALKHTLDYIFQNYSSISSNIAIIGHRFVHGGPHFTQSVLITKKTIKQFESLSDLAPLHNDACLKGIKACIDYFGSDIPQVAVFDTAFHQHMPPVAKNYAIPENIASKYSIRRYGFHGISHSFLWKTYAKQIGASKKTRIITLHLGNGCSMAAIRGGISIDTTMGFTPAEGLVMATRAGDIDAAIVEYLWRIDKSTPADVMEILNKKSGLLGVSEAASDMKTLVELYDKNPQARLAVDLFCYRVLKYLGAYTAALGGIDAAIFSGGIGENSPFIREKILQGLKWMGITLNKKRNVDAFSLPPGTLSKISGAQSLIPIYVIATDENFSIAEEAFNTTV